MLKIATLAQQNARRIAVLVVCTFLLLSSYEVFAKYNHPAWTGVFDSDSAQPIKDVAPADNGWVFTPERDANILSLSHEQCDSAFEELYFEVDRSVAFWKAQGGIKKKDVDIDFAQYGAVRVRISNKRLYILEAKNLTIDPQKWGLRERGLGTLLQLHRAATLTDDLPDIEFAIITADRAFDNSEVKNQGGFRHYPIFTYARRPEERWHDSLWLIPDFNFWAWEAAGGTYGDFRQSVMDPKMDVPLHKRIQKVVWRGALWTNEILRQALLDVSHDKSWSDIETIIWEKEEIKGNPISAPDQCHYAMNVHTEGRSWSGRLKYLLNCHAVTFVHALEWTTFSYHLLRGDGPDQNIVSVHRDFSDLEARVEHLLANPKDMQRIADNAAATFRDRYLTPAAVACYWRHLLRSYAEVSYRPDKTEERGISFEEYLIHEANYP